MRTAVAPAGMVVDATSMPAFFNVGRLISRAGENVARSLSTVELTTVTRKMVNQNAA